MDFAPGLFKGGVVLQGEMALGIAQQVDGAELVFGVREQALNQGSQAGEVVGDQEQGANQAAVFEIDEDVAPGFEDFIAPEGGGGEDLFFAVQADANDQEVNRLFNQAVVVFEFDEFGIDEEAEPIGAQWAGEEAFGFLVQLFQEEVHLLRRIT